MRPRIGAIVLIIAVLSMASAGTNQRTLDNNIGDSWRVELSSDWDVLGPFPIHAREQHFLSPSFPIELTKPIDWDQTYPSSYADGGRVGWDTASSGENGSLNISFPKIRWEFLRTTEGWAALQHHAVLHSILTLYPAAESNTRTYSPSLSVQLIQGSYYTILPYELGDEFTPEWHTGDIYAMERALPARVALPHPPNPVGPTKYRLFIAGDYEIRLFGDPRSKGASIPVQELIIKVGINDTPVSVAHEPTLDVICDFVDGYAFGQALGVAIRAGVDWWTVTKAYAVGTAQSSLDISVIHDVRIAPFQTRIIPLEIKQKAPYQDPTISLVLKLSSDGKTIELKVLIPITQLPQWTSDLQPIRASYFYGATTPTNFVVAPPQGAVSSHISALLALHGAGVDVLGMPFWLEALPRQQGVWTVIPTGRTSWGLDWHGPSSIDAWSSLEALIDILHSRAKWATYAPLKQAPVIVIGHSNGGQGAWHIATHFPDRVAGVIAAAGYIKSQAYVPLTQSRSGHFIDPSLRGILESSLSPDDNDIHLSNIQRKPVFVIHGGDDGNVPTWHGREMYSTLISRGHDPRNTHYREDKGEGHWYPTLYQGEDVRVFLDDIIAGDPLETIPQCFTLTVSSPDEAGSLYGWKIETLSIPGRLGSLRVEFIRGTYSSAKVTTRNVAMFTVEGSAMDQVLVDTEQFAQIPSGKALFERFDTMWKLSRLGPESSSFRQPPLRLQTLLSSPGTLSFVLGGEFEHSLSIVQRLSHNLQLYHRLDSDFILASEFDNLTRSNSTLGDAVYIGSAHDDFVVRLLSQNLTPARISENTGHLMINGQLATAFDRATLFPHPHPYDAKRILFFMLGDSREALERIAKFFPLRTGVPVPGWLIVGPEADQIGAGGIIAAGYYNYRWQWSEAASW